MLCTICESSISKYKCPVCRTTYCTVECWKQHKSTNCQVPVEEVTKDGSSGKHIDEDHSQYQFATFDTVPKEKLKLLGDSEELKSILQNPHVRDMLIAVDASSNPAKAMQAAMVEPIFREFADECLKLIEPAPL